MKTKIFSKFLSMLLALVLVVGLMPVTASAASASVADAAELAAALVGAADGDTITLAGDISGSFSYMGASDKTVTIDGQHHTIAAQDAGGALSTAFTLSGGGTVILKNITLQGGNGSINSYGLYVDSSTIQVHSVGTVSVFGGGAIDCSYGLYHAGSGTVKISTAVGGSGDSSYGIRNNSSGTVYATTATGGSGTSESDGVYNVSAGTVNLETATGGSSVNYSKGIYNRGAGTVNVVTAIGGAASDSSSGDSRGVYNEAGGTINVGTANGGVAAVSYGIYNNGNGTVNANTASGGSDIMNVYESHGVYNNAEGTINVTTAAGGTATNYSYGAQNNDDSGVINVGTAMSAAAYSGHSDTFGNSVHTGTSTATLTLNKGEGAFCVLDSISVAGLGATEIGVLPPVSKDGVAGKWFTTDALTSEFNNSPVNGASAVFSTFYVKPPATLTAGTGGTYSTVADALAAASDGDTIKLLSDMTETSGIVIDGQSITFDLNGKTLDVIVTSGAALTVKNGGSVATQGTGALNVTSGVNDTELGCIGVWVYDTGSSATVTSAKATGLYSRGAYAVAGGSITVTSDATATGESSRGAYTEALTGDASIAVGGNATANGKESYGVYANEGAHDAQITVSGNVAATGEESFGAYVTGNGEVAVIGNVSASGDQSVGVAAGGGTVDVNGSVSTSGGTTGVPIAGVTAQSRTGATITVDGNVTVDGTNGSANNDLYGVAAAGPGSTIQIGGAVTVSGNYGTGAAALEGGIVTVNGDVSAAAVGAEADKGSGVTNLVTIKGKILTSGAYVKVGGETKTTADAIQGTGTDLGYNIFTVMDTGTHTVRVTASGSPAITSANHTSIPAKGGTFQVTATGTAPLTYNLTGAPYGVSIDSSTGLITMDSSCLMHAGTDKSFAVTVSNGTAPAATQNFTLTIRDTPYIQMAGLFNGKVGEAYSTDIAALGSGTITWSISSGTLPAGLSLSGNTISGTPTTAGNYTFTLVATNANGSDSGSYTITINAASAAGGGSGGGGGGGITTTPTTPTTTLSGSTATTSLTPTVSGGKATASVTADQMSDTLKKAQAAAGTNGTPNVDLQISGASSASSVGTTIPHESMQSLVSGGVGAMTISGSTGSVSFDAAALKTISGASGDVTVTVARTESSTLSDDVKKVVGNHPVYEFNVTSGGKTVSEFGGDVTVSVPYTPAPGEDPEAIVIYYIAADGTLTMVPDARYDAANGRVVFTTTHFSTYAIAYNKVSFRDVADTAWYSDAVSFLAARDITSGTTATTFGPNAVLTRGQFITMLLKAYGVAPNTTSGDNFADAGNTYYTGYLAAAKELKISEGVGGNLFAPDKSITRQEMFTMLYNALKAIDRQPEGTSGKAISDFSDASDVASWATDAMRVMVQTGTISGNGGKLSPASTTTRAEMAQVLYNLLGK